MIGRLIVNGLLNLLRGTVMNLIRTQNFPKILNFYPLIRTRTCAYQG